MTFACCSCQSTFKSRASLNFHRKKLHEQGSASNEVENSDKGSSCPSFRMVRFKNSIPEWVRKPFRCHVFSSQPQIADVEKETTKEHKVTEMPKSPEPNETRENETKEPDATVTKESPVSPVRSPKESPVNPVISPKQSPKKAPTPLTLTDKTEVAEMARVRVNPVLITEETEIEINSVGDFDSGTRVLRSHREASKESPRTGEKRPFPNDSVQDSGDVHEEASSCKRRLFSDKDNSSSAEETSQSDDSGDKRDDDESVVESLVSSPNLNDSKSTISSVSSCGSTSGWKKKNRSPCKQTCPVCGMSGFKNYGRYTNHLEVHEGKRPFLCPTCGLGYPTEFKLLDHVARRHTKEPVYNCEKCGKEYKVEIALRKHQCSSSTITITD